MHAHFQFSPEQRNRFSKAIARFPSLRILVVGDLMLDTFIWGEVRRISPEAPVPVVEVREETQLLGGTANVAHNVATLGGMASVAGVAGSDSPGLDLLKLFAQIAVETDGIVVEEDRPTTIKTRVIAQNQQVVRFDRERNAPLSGDSMNRILAFIGDNLHRVDALIVSDYAKGVVTGELMDGLRLRAGSTGIPIIVDPKVLNPDLYRRVTMVTPNHYEASRMSNIDIRDEASLIVAGERLLEMLECEMVLITRGKDGMSLFGKGGHMTHIPTVAQRVFDVTGAGDTVIAAISLGIAAGLAPVEAALLANVAAGIVVGEVGTAAVTAEQLLHAIQNGC